MTKGRGRLVVAIKCAAEIAEAEKMIVMFSPSLSKGIHPARLWGMATLSRSSIEKGRVRCFYQRTGPHFRLCPRAILNMSTTARITILGWTPMQTAQNWTSTVNPKSNIRQRQCSQIYEVSSGLNPSVVKLFFLPRISYIKVIHRNSIISTTTTSF